MLAVLYTTIGTQQEAEHLANKAISEKVAACVNIIPGGKSIYLWNEKIEHSDECYMIFKTTSTLLPELEKWIIKNHPYDIPAIVKFDAHTSADFLDYIIKSVK